MARLDRARLFVVGVVAMALWFSFIAVIARNHHDDGPVRVAAKVTGPATEPLQPVILFGYTAKNDTAVKPVAVRADGSGLTPSAYPAARTDQVLGRRMVASKILDSSSTPYSGCGIAGCSSGYYGYTEAGIAYSVVDGTHERQITRGGYDTEPRFLPDGSIIYLRHRKAPPPYEGATIDSIAVRPPSGAITHEFIPPPGFTYSSFAVSPDGKQVAALRLSTGQPADYAGASDVFAIVIATGEARHVTGGNFRELDWSHDGTRLVAVKRAYMTYADHRGYRAGDHDTGDDLWIVPLDGSAPHQLTHLAPKTEQYSVTCNLSGGAIGQLKQPMWSPDDSSIAFLSNNNRLKTFGRTFDLFVAKADGSSVNVAFSGPADTCEHPDAINWHVETNFVLSLYGWGRGNIAAPAS